jgi:transcriptional regulator with XRE-family HTH domain
MKSYKDFLSEQLQNAEVKKEYKKLAPYYDLARDVVRMRLKRGMTQQQLAEKIESTQAIVSRIESGNSNCSIKTLQKIGEALDCSINLQLIPKEEKCIFFEETTEPISNF